MSSANWYDMIVFGNLKTFRRASCVSYKLVYRRTIVIFRNPPISSINNIFTLPFALSVWTVVLMMILVFTVALIGLTWTSNHLRGKNTQLVTILDTVTMVLGAICQQGNVMTHTTFPLPALQTCAIAYTVVVTFSLIILPLTKKFWHVIHTSGTTYYAIKIRCLRSSALMFSNLFSSPFSARSKYHLIGFYHRTQRLYSSV